MGVFVVYACDCGEGCFRLAIMRGPLWSKWVEEGVWGDYGHDVYMVRLWGFSFDASMAQCIVFVVVW